MNAIEILIHVAKEEKMTVERRILSAVKSYLEQSKEEFHREELEERMYSSLLAPRYRNRGLLEGAATVCINTPEVQTTFTIDLEVA